MSLILTEAHAETLGAILEAEACRPPRVTGRLVAELSPALTAAQRGRALRELRDHRLVSAGLSGLRLTAAGRRRLARS